jgi:hypothetical protein
MVGPLSVLPIQVVVLINIIIRLLAVPRCRGEPIILVLEPNLALECGCRRRASGVTPRGEAGRGGEGALTYPQS